MALAKHIRRRLAAPFLALVVAGCAPASRPDPATPPVGPGDVRALDEQLDARQWLAEPARRAARAGAGPLRPVGASVAAEGDRVGGFVEVPADDCLVALARGSEGITDTDLFVFTDGGDLLASDETTSAAAAVVVCPPHPRRLYVAARVMAGRGIVAAGAMGVAAGAAAAVGELLGAPGLNAADDGRLAAWPGLEAKIRERRRGLGSHWEDLRRAVLPAEPRAISTLSVPMAAGRCLDVLAVPGERVHAIDLWATDSRGRILGRGQPTGRDSGLVVCAAHRGALTVHIRPRASMGPVAVVVGRSNVGAAAQLSSRASVVVAHPIGSLAETTARHRSRTAGLGMSRATRVATVAAKVGAAEPVRLRFARGCTRLDAIGGEPLGAAAVELWSDDGRHLARGIGAEVTTVFRCGPAAPASLEVVAELSAGPVAVELRVEGAPPPVLLRNPIAAARLLGLWEAVAGPIEPARAVHAEPVALAPGHRHRVAVSIPERGCVDVLAAAEGAIDGLALRYVDPATGEEALSRGSATAAARICAAKAVSTQITVEADRGRGPALLLLEPRGSVGGS